MNIAHAIERWAAEQPKATAFVFGGKEVSYRDLNRSVNQLANGLCKLGIRDGDRVAIMLPNTPEFIYTFYACQKIGAVAVPFNTMYKSGEIAHILRDSGSRAIVCLTNSVPLVNEVRGSLPALEHVITTGERSLTFADPQSTLFVQAVVAAALFPSADEAYRRCGAALVDGLRLLGVSAAEYVHIGAIKAGGRKLAGFTIAAVEHTYIVNALCFVDRFDPSAFFSAIWVPPEVKDKMVEPVTSVAEETGVRPSWDEIRRVLAACMARSGGEDVREGALTREERFAREKQRGLLIPPRAGRGRVKRV